VYFAKDKGYFANNGLDVAISDYKGGKSAAAEVLNGRADISTSSQSVFVSSSFIHPDLRTIGTLSTFEHLELIARKDKDIHRIKDLRGKKIGVTKGSSGEFFLGIFLAFNDMSYKDVEIINLFPQGIQDNILNGQIDASFTWEPINYQIKSALGSNANSWPGQSGQKGYFLLLAMNSWLNTHPDATKLFIKSLIETEKYANNNQNEFKEYLGSKFNFDKEHLEYVWSRNTLEVTLPQALLLALEDNARWMIENNLTDEIKVPNYLKYIYFDALENVKPKAIGIID